jgi:hypothetical protein
MSCNQWDIDNCRDNKISERNIRDVINDDEEETSYLLKPESCE